MGADELMTLFAVEVEAALKEVEGRVEEEAVEAEAGPAGRLLLFRFEACALPLTTFEAGVRPVIAADSPDAIAAQAKTSPPRKATCNQPLNQLLFCISTPHRWRADHLSRRGPPRARSEECQSTLNRAICRAAKVIRRTVKKSSRIGA